MEEVYGLPRRLVELVETTHDGGAARVKQHHSKIILSEFIPDICHLFYTCKICGVQHLHSKNYHKRIL